MGSKESKEPEASVIYCPWCCSRAWKQPILAVMEEHYLVESNEFEYTCSREKCKFSIITKTRQVTD